MAEEETAGADESAEPDGPKGAWLKQFVILAVFVMLGQSAVAYFLVKQEIIPWYFDVEGKEGSVGETEAVIVEAPVIYEVAEMIVNPQDYHTLRYLNIKMALELDSQATLDKMKEDPVIPARLVEVVRTTLNMTSFYQMDEARERGPLRKRLAEEINASGVLKEGSVKTVYFQRFVAQ
jgi:flagellar basal body-associated protein FliL